MLEKLNDVPAGIVGLKAIGKLSREDYHKVIEPLLDSARREGHRIRFLYQLGPEFDGFTASAALEDAKIGLRSMGSFAACAVVTDREWIRESTRIAAFFMPCPVRAFANGDRDKAIEWLVSTPREVGIAHRLIPEKGVIVVEVTNALRAEDFDALALTADAWIESHGRLQGIVIHAREFPGWENLGSLLRHVQFVRDHQRMVDRIALAVDSKVAGLAPHIGEHFVRAEIKTFGYGHLDAAVAWAAGAPLPSAT